MTTTPLGDDFAILVFGVAIGFFAILVAAVVAWLAARTALINDERVRRKEIHAARKAVRWNIPDQIPSPHSDEPVLIRRYQGDDYSAVAVEAGSPDDFAKYMDRYFDRLRHQDPHSGETMNVEDDPA